MSIYGALRGTCISRKGTGRDSVFNYAEVGVYKTKYFPHKVFLGRTFARFSHSFHQLVFSLQYILIRSLPPERQRMRTLLSNLFSKQIDSLRYIVSNDEKYHRRMWLVNLRVIVVVVYAAYN